jgi:hypothetical protein
MVSHVPPVTVYPSARKSSVRSLFHLRCSFERHRVQMLVKFRHQPDFVFLHHPRRFVTILVILEPVFNRQPSHADVEARLRGIPVWIAPQNRRMLRNRRLEQDYVNAVMEFLSQVLA